MGQDTSLNNGNCEEHLLKPVASQLAADRLPADYQQAMEGLLTVGLCFGQNLPAICCTAVGPKRPTGN